MSVLMDYDHASDENPIKQIKELRRRLEHLEHYAPTGFFDWATSGAGTSGTIMNPPGRTNLEETFDYDIENQPLALGRVIALYKALPDLISFWPMSAVRRDSATDQARDVSGAGYHLNNNNTSTFGCDGYAPYVEFDGVNQHLSRADGGAANWIDVTAGEAYVQSAMQGLTFGGWFYFDDAPPPANQELLISKRASAAGTYSYWIRRETVQGYANLRMTTDGTNMFTINNSGSPMVADTWYCIVGRFEPSAVLSMFVNGVIYENDTSMPATIFDSAGDLCIGSLNGVAGFLDGRASMCFVCASALDSDLIEAIFQQSRALFGV